MGLGKAPSNNLQKPPAVLERNEIESDHTDSLPQKVSAEVEDVAADPGSTVGELEARAAVVRALESCGGMAVAVAVTDRNRHGPYEHRGPVQRSKNPRARAGIARLPAAVAARLRRRRREPTAGGRPERRRGGEWARPAEQVGDREHRRVGALHRRHLAKEPNSSRRKKLDRLGDRGGVWDGGRGK